MSREETAPGARQPGGDALFTPAIDRRIIDGYLDDVQAMVDELGRAGLSAAAIARRGELLGVTKGSLAQVDASPHRLAARECLRCERTFLSVGIQNRLCRRCRALG